MKPVKLFRSHTSAVVGICDHTQTFSSLSAISHYHIVGQTLKGAIDKSMIGGKREAMTSNSLEMMFQKFAFRIVS